ncbi:hypothetical protein [Devosia sp. SD17-2]|uniref:hypothetical protein n=1 Tax=Devosia sp. SD17-2 TaxID=2976459 RepID=UPI0023D82FBB|nr:hypothetical protein [Devosia sp. SD17-2]WEJ34356.1 hypothetical protein NYQ88_06005 [Devosia sp. SD17-2]
MKPIAIAAMLAATLTLAACGGDTPDQPAAETTAPVVVETTPAAPVVVETTPAAPVTVEVTPPPAVSVEVNPEGGIPGTDVTVEEAVDNVQTQIDNVQTQIDNVTLTDAQKREAVVEARTQAEAAARTAGLSDEQVKQAGDAAENAAKQMFGLN